MARPPDVDGIRLLGTGQTRRLRLFAGGLIAVGLVAAACGGGSATEGAEAGGSSSAPAAGGTDSSPTTAPAETAAASEAQAPTEAGGGEAAGSEDSGTDGTGGGPAAVAVSADVPALEMIDVATGGSVRLVSLVTGDKPLLLWFWAPH